MLQAIREYTQGWIAGIVVTIIILTFGLWGIHSYFVGGGSNTDVAVVNDIPISKEQLAVAYERLRRQMQNQYGANNPISQKDETSLKDRSLQALVSIEVLKQASFDQGFRISDRQIDNYLQNMPEFQVDGRFSFERFQEILSSTLLSTSEFLDLIKTSLLIDQPRLGIVLSAFSIPEDTHYTIALINQEREVSYLTIPMQRFLIQPYTVSPYKIKKYYEEHRMEFMTPEQVNVEYLELSLKELASKIIPSESTLKTFYNENINSYTQPSEWKLAEILVPVSTTASNEEVLQAKKKAEIAYQAMKNGIDVATMSTEYGINYTIYPSVMTLNKVPLDIQKAVAELGKPGQISTPTRTNKGFVIIQALDIQEPKMQSFEAIKDKVREAYVRQHAEEKFATLRDQLADTAYEHPESLQNSAHALNLSIKISEFFTKEKAGKDVSQYKKIRDIAFSNDVLNLQNNSDVIQVNPETVVVMRVKSHVPSALLPMNSVYKQIEEKLRNQEAEAKALKFANELATKLTSGADPNALAASLKLNWTHSGFIGRYSTKKDIDTAISDLAFRLPRPTLENRAVFGVVRLPTGFAIVNLKAIRNGVLADQNQYPIFNEQVQNSEGLLEYELYKQSQNNQAKIKIIN